MSALHRLGQIIVTNDDGVEAAGLAALVEAARQFGEPVVVAPTQCYSQCSHSITTAKHLSVTEVRAGWYAVSGTPSDCVRLAVGHLFPNAQWVLSGINHGGNLGGDVWVSGTVAAAREAALRGRKSIAVSQYRKPEITEDWSVSAARTAMAVKAVLERPLEPGWFWNVNLPAIPTQVDTAVRFCRVDQLPLPAEYRAEGAEYRYSASYHRRPRTAGCDVDVCFGGAISVTRLAALLWDREE